MANSKKQASPAAARTPNKNFLAATAPDSDTATLTSLLGLKADDKPTDEQISAVLGYVVVLCMSRYEPARTPPIVFNLAAARLYSAFGLPAPASLPV
jgi:hypothetical protein